MHSRAWNTIGNSVTLWFLDRIASQTIAACAASVASSISHDHKHLPKQFIITRKTVSRFGVHHPKAAKANHTTFFHSNVPLQTREHALAGISGMLRSLAGAQGAFTSRGAKPKGLNLMLLGLTKKNKQHQPNETNVRCRAFVRAETCRHREIKFDECPHVGSQRRLHGLLVYFAE